MTRGNQRDTDRARAEARAKAGKSNSTIKSAESTADIMRKKQEAADAKKKAAAAAAPSDAGGAVVKMGKLSIQEQTQHKSSQEQKKKGK